jgi:kinesin family protein 18/19
MIANVSPSSMHYEDTYNTLNYANRAKNIKTKAYSNQVHVQTHVSQYRNVIEDLRREVEELKERLREYERYGAAMIAL